jgi:hypothetical protein
MRRVISTAVLGLVFVELTAPASRADDPKELGRAAIQGYRQHWDKFEYLHLRYHQYGSAEPPNTFADAVGLKWKPNKVLNCDFVLDGNRWVLKVDYDDPPFDSKTLVKDKSNPGTAWGPAPFTNRYLGNGTENLYYTPRDRIGALYESGSGDRFGSGAPRSTPLHILGFHNPNLNPNELLLAAERNQKPWAAGPPTDVNGSQCVPVSFDTPDGFRTVFHLDLNRGCIPIRIQKFEGNEKKGEELERTDVLDLRACSNGRWVPMKILSLRFPAAVGVFEPVVREVTEFDVDRRPTKDELSVDMEAGTRITRQSKPEAKYSVTLRQGERIGPDDIARVIEISEGRQENPLTDTAIHSESRPLLWYVLAVVTVIVVGAVVWYWRVGRLRVKTP